MKLFDSIFDEFYLTSNGGISQNPFSLKLFLKSLYYTNSGLIYLTSLINFYQSLEPKELNDVLYSSYSHAITTYCLKMLDKKGIVKIEKSEQSGTLSLEAYYYSIGNSKCKSKIKMYYVTFYKLRDLTIEDRPLIESIAHILNISDGNIDFIDNDGQLRVNIPKEVASKNIRGGLPLKRLLAHLKTETPFASKEICKVGTDEMKKCKTK